MSRAGGLGQRLPAEAPGPARRRDQEVQEEVCERQDPHQLRQKGEQEVRGWIVKGRVLVVVDATRLNLRRLALIALAALAAVLGAGAPLAHADKVSFTSPGNSPFTVPAGVTTIAVDAVGAAGGGGRGCGIYIDAGSSGGRGAVVAATLVVRPGEQLVIGVGAVGGSGLCGGGS